LQVESQNKAALEVLVLAIRPDAVGFYQDRTMKSTPHIS